MTNITVIGKNAFATGWDLVKGGAICPVCGLDDATRMMTGCPMKKK